ncbi:hypothetical protein ACLOJK_037285 [Asimina triloba]
MGDIVVEICHGRILVLVGSERETLIKDITGDDQLDVAAMNGFGWLDSKEMLPVEGDEDVSPVPIASAGR